MSIIVINLIADAIELYGIGISPYRATYHKSVINYGDQVTLFFYHNKHIRQVTHVV